MSSSVSNLVGYIEILQDSNCLKILYYLRHFNPDIPIGEISNKLNIDKNIAASCMAKLMEAKFVVKEARGGYSLTKICRNAFEDLLER